MQCHRFDESHVQDKEVIEKTGSSLHIHSVVNVHFLSLTHSKVLEVVCKIVSLLVSDNQRPTRVISFSNKKAWKNIQQHLSYVYKHFDDINKCVVVVVVSAGGRDCKKAIQRDNKLRRKRIMLRFQALAEEQNERERGCRHQRLVEIGTSWLGVCVQTKI